MRCGVGCSAAGVPLIPFSLVLMIVACRMPSGFCHELLLWQAKADMAYVQHYVAAGQSELSLCRSQCVGGRIGGSVCYIYMYVAMRYFIARAFVS